MNFANFLRTPFFMEHLRWLLLHIEKDSVLDFLQFVILMNPRPLSILGMYNLSVSLCGWYIVFIVIMFRVFLSITFSSSFAHFSIPAPYLTKDTAREFISLMYFSSIVVEVIRTVLFFLQKIF